MTRILSRQARHDLSTNPSGLDDGGLNISGGLYGLMSHEPAGSVGNTFLNPNKKKRCTRCTRCTRGTNGIHKKIKTNPIERPGEQEND